MISRIFLIFSILFCQNIQGEESGQAAPLQKLTVALGYHIDPCQASILYALHKGIFERYGLSVSVTPSSGGEEASRSVAMKKADIGITKLANHMIRLSKDMPLRQIGVIVPKTLEVLMIRKDVGGIRNLKNKRIGYSTSNPTFTMAVMEKILKIHGISMEDITLIAFQKGLASALATGAVDAAFTLTDPYETLFMEEHGVDVHTFRYQEFGIPEFPQFILFTHKDDHSADFVPRFNAALAEALREMKTSPGEAWIFLCKHYPELDSKLGSRIFLRLIEMFQETPAIIDIEVNQTLLNFLEKTTFDGQKILEKPLFINEI